MACPSEVSRLSMRMNDQLFREGQDTRKNNFPRVQSGGLGKLQAYIHTGGTDKRMLINSFIRICFSLSQAVGADWILIQIREKTIGDFVAERVTLGINFSTLPSS